MQGMLNTGNKTISLLFPNMPNATVFTGCRHLQGQKSEFNVSNYFACFSVILRQVKLKKSSREP